MNTPGQTPSAKTQPSPSQPTRDAAPASPSVRSSGILTRRFTARVIRGFFGSSALVSLLVLALITIFLFREGLPFFAENQRTLALYRHAGLEYVDLLRRAETEHTALIRELSEVRLRAFSQFTDKEHSTVSDANARLALFDSFVDRFSDTISPVREIASDLGERAAAIKTLATINNDKATERAQFLAAGKAAEAEQIQLEPVDFARELRPLLDTLPASRNALRALGDELRSLLAHAPASPTSETAARMAHFHTHARAYLANLPTIEHALADWDPQAPLAWHASVSTFITGREWLTASFWQDRYGILPLLTGSLLVSLIALLFAVPLGVGAAIYVSQVATAREQRLIKPCIEFISALPSVVLGFFGIAILGELLRGVSQNAFLNWLPGFPIIERLNALTAGCLLALISIPTIFTLAEDALTNVPRALREASFALGASRLQTILKIITPAALSGIISAVLLGFGRVIGETMIVLLCAGNRIAIPDFLAGPAVITQPVHTMTGIIAQEMGEVVRGSIHYRALFVVGIVLFLLSLAINVTAQKILRKYRHAAG